MDIFNQPFEKAEGAYFKKSNKDFVRVNKKNKTITFGKNLLKKNEIGFPDGKLTFIINLMSAPCTIIFNPPRDKVKSLSMIHEIQIENENWSPSKGSAKLVNKIIEAWNLPKDVEVWDATMEVLATDLDTGIKCFSLKPED